MIFSAAGLSLYFNKTTFAVERLAAEGDPEALSFVTGKTFGLPSGNNFLTKSDYLPSCFSAEFLFFNNVVCTLRVEEKQGTVAFSYEFKNDDKEAVTLEEGDLGIYLPFCDKYDEMELSLRRRVHAHVRTQGTCYAYCERYSGVASSLGMLMVEGESRSYALERGVSKGERGEIIIRLPAMKLSAGECYRCELRFFLCENREELLNKADAFEMLTATASDLVVFEGEEITFRSDKAKSLTTDKAVVPFEDGVARIKAEGVGEHWTEIRSDEKVILGSYFVLPKALPKKRVCFVTERQYVKQGKYRGAFAPIDRSTGEIVLRSGVGGYCAAPLLFLLHEWAAGRLPEEMKGILKDAIAFYDKEIYRGGEVMDDVSGKRSLIHKRYDHYPLFAAIKFEEYRFNGDLAALVQSAVILSNYFKSGSGFLPTPVSDVAEELRKQGKAALADELIESLAQAAERLIAQDRKSALSGCVFSADFFCGAVACLLDLYSLTEKQEYLSAAKAYLSVLDAFSFPSSNYALDDVPELFKSDLKYGLTYDMAPHYTAIRFAVAYDKYYRATGESKYAELSRKITCACVSLFESNGAASSSKAAASVLNDRALSSYEEISCGEDIVLYYFDLLFGRK